MAETNDIEAADAPDVHVYWRGEALEGQEALAVTQAVPARVVVVAGPAESGKTTLVAGLYEMFHLGPFAGYLFAGSRTLVGFERRCHLARRASGLETPDTERTSRSSGQPMLHLRVRPDGRAAADLLITDIYGEAFRHAADSTDECQRLGVLRRADHVAVLLDGARLAALKTRQQPFVEADALLRSCEDAGMLDSTSQVQVVVTKADLLRADGEAGGRRFVADRLKWLSDRHAPRLGRLATFEVAVRPTVESGLGVGHGLSPLFTEWVEQPRRAVGVRSVARPAELHSEYDRFARAWPVASSVGT